MIRCHTMLTVFTFAVGAWVANLVAAPPADQLLPDLIHVKDNYPRGEPGVYPVEGNVLNCNFEVLRAPLPLDPKHGYKMSVYGLCRLPKDDPRCNGFWFSAHYPPLRDNDVFPLMGEFFRVVRHVGEFEFDIAKCRPEQLPPCKPLRTDTLVLPVPGILVCNSRKIRIRTFGLDDYDEWIKGLIPESPLTYRFCVDFSRTDKFTEIPVCWIDAKQGTLVDLPNCQLKVRQISLPNKFRQQHGFIEFDIVNPIHLGPNRTWPDLYEEFAAKANAKK